MTNKYSEKITKKTSNGGVYSIVNYQDKDGNRTTKDKAVKAEICDYDKNDKVIFRTYGKISK